MATKDLSKLQKLATFLVLIGPEMASEILRHFDDYEIERICREMAVIELIDEAVQQEILDEFAQVLSESAGAVRGGYEVTRKTLELAKGGYQAQNLIGKMTPSQDSMSVIKEIAGMDPLQIYNLVKSEQPQTIAFLLSCLDSRKSAAILKYLAPDAREDVMLRMGTLEATSLTILEKVVKNLARHLDSSRQATQRTGGATRVADILLHLDKDVSKALLGQIEEKNANLGAAIRQKMFTFNDLVRLTAADMQRVLRDVDSADLVVAMKPVSQALKEKIYGALSKRAAESLREELDFLGAVRMKEVEAAQAKIIAVVRDLEDQEEIILDGNHDGLLA